MRKYRTFFTVEELWCKIASEDCPYSREIIYSENPSESEEDDDNKLRDAVRIWETEYKNSGLVMKPKKLYYYKNIERFVREGRYNGK